MIRLAAAITATACRAGAYLLTDAAERLSGIVRKS